MTSRYRILTYISALAISLAVIAEPTDSRFLKEAEALYGKQGSDTVRRWKDMLDNAGKTGTNEKLLMVNDFFNQNVAFRSDQEIWGKSDYWATPLQTMGIQQGDCEDFSIAKYVSLLKLGIPDEQLRLVYVKADIGLSKPQAHMVVAYYTTPTSEPFILDNLSTEIRPASQRSDLVPVFSFNSNGLWIGNDSKAKANKPETRLSRWRDVLLRMRAEGLDTL
ncbi:MAG: transglutaminase-like cysteine peptidase [Ketobacter sp.]|uniref:transglutaminase-like cysteine peptidase n=1 Tax=Ketobacter sp. MCCC 1A13808 TaxID=2602738 RepID=UPI0018DC0233|nr:transglutaminase-like cysteine peptidase [Ketobacter sp. MCCC 1A13808]